MSHGERTNSPEERPVEANLERPLETPETPSIIPVNHLPARLEECLPSIGHWHSIRDAFFL